MRLVIATPLYPPEPGGPATHAKLLEEFLPAEGVETVVIPFRTVRHLPSGIRHLAYAWRVYKEARAADAIFAEDTMSSGLPALIAARLARKPFIVRVPGDFAWEQGVQRFGVSDTLDAFQEKRYGWRVELLRGLMRFVVRSADQVVVPTEYFHRIVSGWMKDVAKLMVIYNGIDLAIVPEPPQERPQGLLAVSVGRLVPWKGFDTLIGLMKELPDWTLVIIGDGPDRERLEEVARAAGVLDRVRFLGTLSRAALLGWCSVADAFVLNSSFESFSYQVVEALSTGVPVIATDVGSIPELVTDGTDGTLVAPDDRAALTGAIRSIREEPDVWRVRSDAGRVRARAFGAEETARRFKELVFALANGAP